MPHAKLSVLPETKLAVSSSSLTLSQSRSGRKPMSMATLLRKDDEGTLFRRPSALFENAGSSGKKLLDKAQEGLGVTLEELGQRKLLQTAAARAGQGLNEFLGKEASAQQILEAFMSKVPDCYEKLAEGPGKFETNVPWYTTAVGGTLGHAAGSRLLAKKPLVGAPLGLLGDTAAGLHGGTALGRKADQRKVGSDQAQPGDVPTRKVPQPETQLFVTPLRLVETAKVAEEPYILSVSELEKVCCLYFEELAALEGAKVAGTRAELQKQALLGALGKVIPQSRKIVQLGGETIDLRPKSMLSYKGVGEKLQQLGGMYKLPTGATPEAARAVGNMRGGSIGGRVLGEGLSSAGHHMGHAPAASKVLNPLGKPIGGFIEGVSRASGQELQRAGGNLRSAVGRGLVKHAPTIGAVGELGTAAGSATALGHAISPIATGLGALVKSTGVYAPLKHQMGSLGLNVAKDVAATGAERAVVAGSKGLKGLGGVMSRIVPSAMKARAAVAV